MRYYFTQNDIDLCTSFANSVAKLKANFKTTRKLNQNPHYLGKLGELVFSKQFNLPVDFSVDFKGDCGYDFKLGNFRIDVKTTQYWKFPELKEFVDTKALCDAYVLVCINTDDLYGDLCGFISAKKFSKIEPSNYRNLGMRRVADKSKLCKDWDLLINYANNYKVDGCNVTRFKNAKLV